MWLSDETDGYGGKNGEESLPEKVEANVQDAR